MRLFQETAWRWWWLVLLLLVVDQVTKQLVHQQMSLGQSIDLLPFFNLTYVRNYGAAFSFLSDAGGWQRWFFTVLAIVMSVIISIWMSRAPAANLKLGLALSLILAGAVGNLIDRSIFGFVIDFFHLHYQGWSYPVFNIADSVICIGAALLIWESFTNETGASNERQ